jgi:fido (protein-threonine AMPylation protein)
VLTEEGEVRIVAPYSGITPAGTKRVLYIHEDTTWITIHLNLTNTKNLEELEEDIIAKSFDELPEGKREDVLELTSEDKL